MEFVKQGKTKDIYKLENGNFLLKFKDTVTGHPGGEKDPGGNSVVGTVKGVGNNALKVTVYYFELLKKQNIKSHYVSADISKNEMVVKPAVPFGKGLEFVCRYIATGSFYKRFPLYCKDGDILDPCVFEVTLKDDERNDPPATIEILTALKLMTKKQYELIKKETIKICGIVKDDLKKKGMDLYDIKLEFGLVDGKVTLIDEISAGNMRVFKNGVKLDYEALSNLILK